MIWEADEDDALSVSPDGPSNGQYASCWAVPQHACQWVWPSERLEALTCNDEQRWKCHSCICELHFADCHSSASGCSIQSAFQMGLKQLPEASRWFTNFCCMGGSKVHEPLFLYIILGGCALAVGCTAGRTALRAVIAPLGAPLTHWYPSCSALWAPPPLLNYRGDTCSMQGFRRAGRGTCTMAQSARGRLAWMQAIGLRSERKAQTFTYLPPRKTLARDENLPSRPTLSNTVQSARPAATK